MWNRQAGGGILILCLLDLSSHVYAEFASVLLRIQIVPSTTIVLAPEHCMIPWGSSPTWTVKVSCLYIVMRADDVQDIGTHSLRDAYSTAA
jgi:hypothetical protein